ncbi:hypothetical protein H5T87_06515 [bacterium]|nr:hypothetical protein [bacterium]
MKKAKAFQFLPQHFKPFVLSIIFLLSLSPVFCGAKAEVLYMEPAPPAPPPKPEEWRINSAGDATVGRQWVKDESGESKGGLIGKIVFNLNGQKEKQEVNGSIQFNRQFMTTGDLKDFGLRAEWKGEKGEFSLLHNLSDKGNIASRIYNLSHLKDTKLNMGYKEGEWTFSFNISQTNNQNRSAGVLQQNVDAKQKVLSIIKKGQNSETRLIWSDVTNSSPLTGLQSTAKNLSLKSIHTFKNKMELSFGLESMDTDSRSGRTLPMVSSSNRKYSLGVTTPLGDRWKFRFNYDYSHNNYSSAGRSTSTTTNMADYTISYQLLPPLAWELTYNIFKTSGQSETRRLYTRLSLTGAPRGYFRLGSSSLLYQLLSVKDRTGKTVSENNQFQLIIPLNLGTKTNLMSTITLGKQESAGGPTTRTTDMKNYNLSLNHRATPTTRYFAQYNTNDTSTRGMPSNSVDNYRLGLEVMVKFKGQQMPISLTRTSSSSSYGAQGSDVKETAITLGLPTASQRTRISYIFALTDSESSTTSGKVSRDAKRHSLNLSLANKKGDLRLEGLLSFIDTTEDLFNLSLSLVYQKPKVYKLSFLIFRNKECFFPGTPFNTQNLLLEFVYNF